MKNIFITLLIILSFTISVNSHAAKFKLINTIDLTQPNALGGDILISDEAWEYMEELPIKDALGDPAVYTTVHFKSGRTIRLNGSISAVLTGTEALKVKK